MNLKELEKKLTKNFTIWQWIKWYWWDIELFFTDEIPFRISLWKNRPKYSIKSNSGLTITELK